MKFRFLIVCALLQFLCVQIAQCQKRVLSGYVRAHSLSEPISNATVFEVNNKRGTVTDSLGYFEVALKKWDSLLIEVSHLNYQKEFITFYQKPDTCISIILSKRRLELQEVSISVANDPLIEHTTHTRINSCELNLTPSLGGEKDILRALQFTPGVQGGMEGTTGLIVRGGEPGQNLFLIDNMPIYSPSHLYGFMSSFNPDLIHSATLVRSGLPSNHGGKLSSLVDIKSNHPSHSELKGSVSIGIVSSKIYSEIPILKGSSGLLFSYRRSYFDVLTALKSMYDQDNERNEIAFSDLHMKYEHRINENSEFAISFLTGKDKIYYLSSDPEGYGKSEDITGVDWSQKALFLNYKWRLKEGRKFLLFTGIHSYKANNISENYLSNKIESQLIRSSSLADLSIKLEAEELFSKGIKVVYGYGFTHHFVTPLSVRMLSKELVQKQENSDEMALFIHSYFSLSKAGTLSLGLRQNGYFSRFVNYFPVEPRVSYIKEINCRWTIKSSFSRNVQFLHRIEDYSAGLPFEKWKISDEMTPFANGYQLSTEIQRKLDRPKLLIGLSGFCRMMNGLIEADDIYHDFSEMGNLGIESYNSDGDGRAYGIEFFSSKKTGSFNYSITYSLSKSDRRFEGVYSEKWYPSNYDRRHYLSAQVIYKLDNSFTFSANWIFSSGQPVTIPEGQYLSYSRLSDQSMPIYYIANKNNYRLEPYHRLDLSIQHKRIKRNGIRIWEFSLYNAYNRANPFVLDIEDESFYDGSSFVIGERKIKQYSLFPIIPSINYVRKFN